MSAIPDSPVRKIVVTGATSQIGRFLLPRLVGAGYEVIAVSRQVVANGEAVQWWQGDITSPNFVWPRAEGWIHLAPLRLLPPLLAGFQRMGGRRLVCFGTTSRYSKATSSQASEQAFAREQIAAEAVLAERCAALGLNWTLFRPTLIYGCALDRNVTVMARLIRRFGAFPLFGGAQGLRQPVHADDLAAACVAVLVQPRSFNQAYDLSGGETLSYRQMAERIFQALGRRPRFVSIPLWGFNLAMRLVALVPRFKDFNGEMARRMNDDLVFDSSAAVRDFGYQPRPFQPALAELSGEIQCPR